MFLIIKILEERTFQIIKRLKFIQLYLKEGIKYLMLRFKLTETINTVLNLHINCSKGKFTLNDIRGKIK